MCFSRGCKCCDNLCFGGRCHFSTSAKKQLEATDKMREEVQKMNKEITRLQKQIHSQNSPFPEYPDVSHVTFNSNLPIPIQFQNQQRMEFEKRPRRRF